MQGLARVPGLRRALVLAVALAVCLLGGLGTGAVSGPGGGAARAGARVMASPASCVPRRGDCPNQVVLGAGSWCWFGDPRAVHLLRGGLDEVLVGWLTPTGQVTVESIDQHGHMRRAVLARLYADDHVSPSLSVEPDNRVTVYWSGHNGAHMFYATSRHPGDISSWGPTREVPHNTPGGFGFTYPNPVILSAQGDRHYLFWRGGDWEPAFATRTVHGAWSAPHVLIDVPGRRPYMKVASNGRDRIGLAFTDGHPDNDVTSLYFAEIRHDRIYAADGRELGVLGGAPVIPSAEERVYDAWANRGARSWLQDVAFDRSGHPVIVYSVYPRGASAQYWYARWDGHGWMRRFLADSGPPIAASQPHYLGGAVLDHAHPGIVYVSVPVRRRLQIERWVTRDGGLTWTVTALTRSTRQSIRPVVAQELPGVFTPATTIFALRGPYVDYWHFRTVVTMLSSRFEITDRDADLTRDLDSPGSSDAATNAGQD